MENWKILRKAVVIIIIANLVVTSIMQRIMCTEMTETKLFLELLNNFFWNFKQCN